MSSNLIYEAACSYCACGYSVIPVNSNKRPTIFWKSYQTRRMTDVELKQHFASARGIALVCGFNDLELIDFDAANLKKYQHEPYDIVEDYFVPYLHAIEKWLESNQYTLAKSQSGGRHIFIRVDGGVPDGNLELAHIPAISKSTDKAVKKVVIETRGVGGYVMCFPTKGYQFLHGNLEDLNANTQR